MKISGRRLISLLIGGSFGTLAYFLDGIIPAVVVWAATLLITVLYE